MFESLKESIEYLFDIQIDNSSIFWEINTNFKKLEDWNIIIKQK